MEFLFAFCRGVKFLGALATSFLFWLLFCLRGRQWVKSPKITVCCVCV